MREFNQEEFHYFFSGTEPDNYFEMVAEESNTMLMSYFHAKKKGKKFLAERFKICPDLQLIVDSGAFTFLGNPEEHTDKEDSYWDKYLTEYCNFITSNKEHVFAAGDLDIDEVVGSEKVDEWREKYFKPLEDEGIQMIYMWHPQRGDRGWEEMCKKHKYICVEYIS